MGAAASLPEYLSLADSLSLQDLELLGISRNQYDALKDDNGLVQRIKIIQAIDINEEREVYECWKTYCYPNSEMNCETFTVYLRNAKLLAKKDLTKAESDKIFNEIKGNSNTINYDTFRRVGLLELAKKKRINIRELIFKLSRMEPFSDAQDVIKIENKSAVHTIDQKSIAATKIQSVHRANLAKKVCFRLKKIRAILEEQTYTDDDFPTLNTAHEVKLQAIYKQYSAVNGELSSSQFEKLLFDYKVFDHKFTSADAHLTFLKAKAKAQVCISGPCQGGVVYGKRIKYEVFRLIALVDIASQIGISVDSLILNLTAAGVVTGQLVAHAGNHREYLPSYTPTGSRRGSKRNSFVIAGADLIKHSLSDSGDTLAVVDWSRRKDDSSKTPSSSRPSSSHRTRGSRLYTPRDFGIDAATTELNPEQELTEVLYAYCPSGEMDSRAFLSLVRDAKLLAKKDLTMAALNLIFEKLKQRSHTSTPYKTISFECVWKYGIIEIAAKKNMKFETILDRLCRLEGPNLKPNTEPDSVTNRKSGLADSELESFGRSDSIEAIEDNSGEPKAIDSTAEEAVVKLQALARAKRAMHITSELHEIKLIKQKSFTEKDFPSGSVSKDKEEKVRRVFTNKYSSSGLMDTSQFEKMLLDAKLCDKRFTGGEADILFQKAKAKAAVCLSGPCSGGVVRGKKVKYDVFRLIALVDVAAKKGLKVEDIIDILSALNDK